MRACGSAGGHTDNRIDSYQRRRPRTAHVVVSVVTATGKRPVSIPNPEAKPDSADGTAPARVRESRTPPSTNINWPGTATSGSGPVCFRFIGRSTPPCDAGARITMTLIPPAAGSIVGAGVTVLSVLHGGRVRCHASRPASLRRRRGERQGALACGHEDGVNEDLCHRAGVEGVPREVLHPYRTVADGDAHASGRLSGHAGSDKSDPQSLTHQSGEEVGRVHLQAHLTAEPSPVKGQIGLLLSWLI